MPIDGPLRIITDKNKSLLSDQVHVHLVNLDEDGLLI
jgi:hypothetical protein